MEVKLRMIGNIDTDDGDVGDGQPTWNGLEGRHGLVLDLLVLVCLHPLLVLLAEILLEALLLARSVQHKVGPHSDTGEKIE